MSRAPFELAMLEVLMLAMFYAGGTGVYGLI